jgi:Zn-dependent protease with chaperone function
MVLWQAVALAAVLAALGAGISLVTGSALAAHRSPVWHAVVVVALGLTATVLGRLLLRGHQVGTRLRATRRHHRRLLDLLCSEEAGMLVVSHPTPVAYCVPGVPRSRVVVSEGARRVLGRQELDAVIAHERAHLRARHDLVLEAFTVLQEAFPRLVSSAAALAEVRLLVEVLADRAARRRAGARSLARALAALAEGAPPEAALGAGGDLGSTLLTRIELIRDARPHRLLAGAQLVTAVAIVVLPTVFVAWPWMASLV